MTTRSASVTGASVPDTWSDARPGGGTNGVIGVWRDMIREESRMLTAGRLFAHLLACCDRAIAAHCNDA